MSYKYIVFLMPAGIGYLDSKQTDRTSHHLQPAQASLSKPCNCRDLVAHRGIQAPFRASAREQ